MHRTGYLSWLRKALVTAVVLVPTALAAQGFPSRPLTLIVPYPAGSTTDIIARLVAAPLSARLKQPVVVENKAGAGAAIGVTVLKQAPKDGYTFGLIVSGNVIQPWMQKDMPFDVRKDFTALTLMYAGQYVLTVTPAFPAKTFPEFLAYAKANPQKIFFGSSGTGTTTHLAAELLKQLTGIKMTHVPFKGSPQVFAAMMSGDVQAYFDLYGSAKPLIDSGQIRALAVTSKKRMAVLPDLPAISEIVPGYETLVWTGFAVPVGTPKDVTSLLTAELQKVLQEPELRKRLTGMGVEPGGNPSAEFTAFVAKEYDKWGKIVQAAGIKPE